MKKISLVFAILVTMVAGVMAQDFRGLQAVPSFPFKVYSSKGFEQRAGSIARRCSNAMDYLGGRLGFRPGIVLLVLSQADWSGFTQFPVYGMPHYNNDSTLIVAAEDNDFWRSFIPPMENLPAGLAGSIRSAYGAPDGTVSMRPFFDLLALHELGHAFHFQGGLQMQRRWMGGLFCNILLHTYIAEKEQDQLPALTVFPRMVIAAGTNGYPYTSLQDLQQRYDEIGQRHAKNYGWYQSRLHAGAGVLYDKAGSEIVPKLWQALMEQNVMADDRQLAAFLGGKVHPGLAELILNW